MERMIEILQWDSEFFGFGIGKIDLAGAVELGSTEIERQMQHQDIRLLYIFHQQDQSPVPLHSKDFTQHTGATLVDRKVVFAKALEEEKEKTTTPGISRIGNHQPTPQLYSLALQSGVYSRFRLDKNFPPGSFGRMYKMWLEKSLSGELADEVLIAGSDPQTTPGMATLSLKNDTATIGLIAVDEKARGQKTGHKLMTAARQIAAQAGKTQITVATQLDNHAACAFYKQLGYEVKEIWQVYHLWREAKN